MSQADELRLQQALRRRLEAMGLEVRVLPGGRSLLATLPMGPEPFETPGGARQIRSVRFYSVGHERIKCCAPRALFHLPLVRIVDCEAAVQVEARIRAAWADRMANHERARRWLAEIGVESDSFGGVPGLRFGLGLEDAQARAGCVEPGRVILPSRGPLSGSPLARPEERIFELQTACRTAADLELAVTTRLERLARRGRRAHPARAGEDPFAPRPARRTPVLLVGPRLGADHGLHESLRLRGYRVQPTRSIAEALQALREHSFEAVLADTTLDRGDGIELIPALRALSSLRELPIALIDDRPREVRRGARGRRERLSHRRARRSTPRQGARAPHLGRAAPLRALRARRLGLVVRLPGAGGHRNGGTRRHVPEDDGTGTAPPALCDPPARERRAPRRRRRLRVSPARGGHGSGTRRLGSSLLRIRARARGGVDRVPRGPRGARGVGAPSGRMTVGRRSRPADGR